MCARNKDEEEIFCKALEFKSAEERDAYLSRACEHDTKLLARVRALLAVQDNERSALEDAAPFLKTVSQAGPILEAPGTNIGNYQLLEQIGEGGMAVVYMAEQEKPIRRKVALKIVKLGMDTRQVIARFEAERQALALMNHPNIAKVLDAGATDTGRPYFVMELVKGISITEYCDKKNLTVQERLGLFSEVCHAVQHAHQKGIIHRDIKPSNVMVTLRDGEPVPKIIDFGIAKATNRKLTEKTLFTRYAQMIGTPAYMSPEQAEFSELDIDTRSDIYSLGVLLYELLTGTTPFDQEKLREAGYAEMQQIICREDPVKPSTKLSTMGEESAVIAMHRRSSPDLLTKLIRGDLDWIVMKSLEKERRLRYATASEFAADIGRHLNNEPVQAAAPSVSYRLRKHIKRHRVGVIVTVLVAAALMTGLVVSTAMYFQTRQAWDNEATARTDARRQAKIALAVNEFLNKDLLASADPAKGRGRDVTVREVLDAASEKIEGKFKDEPLVEASIREMLGRMYRRLGDSEAAELHLRRALKIREKQLGKRHSDTLYSMTNLAVLYETRQKYDQAEGLLSEALVNLLSLEGEEARNTLSCMNNLATVRAAMGRHREAETLLQRVFEISRRSLGADHIETLAAMNNLATLYNRSGRHRKAAELFAKTLEATRRVLGADHPQTISAMHNLARLYHDHGQYDKAHPLYLEALKTSRRVLGEQHPDTVQTMSNLAVLLLEHGRHEMAEPLFVKTLDINRRIHGQEHRQTLQAMNNLAEFYNRQKRHKEAELLFVSAFETARQMLGDEHPQTTQAMNGLKSVYKAQERYDEEVEQLLLKLLDIRSRALGEEHRKTLQCAADLGSLYYLQQRYEKAMPLLVKTSDGLSRTLGAQHPDTLTAMFNLAQLYTEQEQYSIAEKQYIETLEAARDALGENHSLTLMVKYNLGVMYRRKSQYNDAERQLLSVVQTSERVSGADHPNTIESVKALVKLYTAWGRSQEAEKWRTRLLRMKPGKAY